ncbi:MAG: hypothetical protein M3304_13070, partial [Actinomycetota bacterium]|nr:hypothetical protein [Actinomycetota bacterium]
MSWIRLCAARRTLFVLLASVLLVGVAPANAFAVHHLGYFELDRDAQGDGTAGDDWENIFLKNDAAAASVFVTDEAGRSDDAFTQGSKDVQDLSEWRWASPGIPPKDDLLHAYAAAYESAEGTIVYFGADRIDTSGDAELGFWFLQKATAENADGTFTGEHVVGDVLVLSHFERGGRVDDIQVYKWVGGSEPLELVLDEPGEDSPPECPEMAAGDDVCATVNNADTPSPWPYEAQGPKAPSNVFPAEAFFEGGANVTAILPAGACFSSFVAETRSSSSLVAELKDKVIGALSTCPPPPPPAPTPPPPPGPFVPPAVCASLSLSRETVVVGHRARVRARVVDQNGAPMARVRVRARGAGVRMT